ncbi:hypothetical protein N9Y48_05330, partial [Zobellia sp.]|nr:hypothetical protein [Zobellia sp.]
ISRAAANPSEAGAGTSFTLTRTSDNIQGNTVTIAFSGDAVNGVDFTDAATGNAIATSYILNNVTSEITVNINTTDDQLVELDEPFNIAIATVSNGGTASGTGEVDYTIADNDIGTFTLSTTEPNAAEEGTVRGRFVLTLDKENATGSPVRIPITLGGTATLTDDYTATGQVAEFTFATQLVRVKNINVIDDPIAEGDETVTLTLGQPSNTTNFTYVQTPIAQRTVTIVDNDCAAGDTAPTINGRANSVCNPPTATVNLNTYVVGGAAGAPTGSSLRWSETANPTTEAALRANATITTSGTYHAVYWADDNSCFTTSNPVTITFNTPPSTGTVSSPQTACNNTSDEFGANSIVLNSASVISGQDAGTWAFTSGPVVINPVGTNSQVSFSGQTSGAYVYTFTTTGAVTPCTNQSITVTINVDDCDPCTAGSAAPVLDTSVQRTFCDDITTSLNDYAPNSGPNASVLRWSTSNTDPTGSFVPTNRVNDPLPGTYYGFYYDATNDCASPLLQLTLSQSETPEITSSAGDSRCGPGSVVIRATATQDATINWYTRATGGAPVATGASYTINNLANTTTYYVEAEANGCVSPTRVEVEAVIFGIDW